LIDKIKDYCPERII